MHRRNSLHLGFRKIGGFKIGSERFGGPLYDIRLKYTVCVGAVCGQRFLPMVF